ncbi:hypothetical protein K3888_15055 [Dietzia aurantiaca]|uniref:hypothetical protein n=1 Tax=Dietzia aurantiaca TaxID=983873 RepID=UPI001E58508E|nr:hypothetical protein [Dietzia aurantiaca]MCD2264016.1 hypothetical protein [Dietzia aurantiaca]
MEPTGEAREAAEVDAARRHLLEAGADRLARQPWQPSWAPPDDATLLRFAVRQAGAGVGRVEHADVRAALALVETAREDLDALESALILIARAEGLTWPDIARQLRVRTPQAAQQRFRRVSTRVEAAREGAGGGDEADDEEAVRQ